MPDREQALAVMIGYSEDAEPYFALQEFITITDRKVELSPKKVSPKKLRRMLAPYDKYTSENRISVDLFYMKKMLAERQRQRALLAEQVYIMGLWDFVFPCCERVREMRYE
jgi:hypothetical protein